MWVPRGLPPFPEGQARRPPSPRLTNEQFTEKFSGLMVCSWYIILQTMITHVQTVQTLLEMQTKICHAAQHLKTWMFLGNLTDSVPLS